MKTAVIIPCHNESMTIEKVIKDFRKELPSADIYVYDNNSTDNTALIANNAGAIVHHEYRQGKGNVVRSMFRDIEADIYVMVDGDDTYPADRVHDLIDPILRCEADMVTGDRLSSKAYKKANTRPFHEFGNNIVAFFINRLFKTSLNDVMSGYRAFNRLFVKTIMVLSKGFEIETEIVLHALDKRFLIKEIPIVYRNRIEGSHSKLKTFEDGLKVMRTILWVFKDYKPLVFFGFASFILFIMLVFTGTNTIVRFESLDHISQIIHLSIVGFLFVSSLILLAVGLMLDTVVKFHRLDYERSINAFMMDNPSIKDKE